jgi:AraC family transcriptional regulator of adaptative response/methylated-DNA-[protein]-cysteine methyltransferase
MTPDETAPTLIPWEDREPLPTMHLEHVHTSFGPAILGLADESLVWFSFGERGLKDAIAYWPGPHAQANSTAARASVTAEDLSKWPLRPLGTPFQHLVWQLLLCLPTSATTTYKEIALRLGSTNYARAVGSAVAANPISWMIPCHRVLPVSGNVGNYRWGASVKAALLDSETTTTCPSGEALLT